MVFIVLDIFWTASSLSRVQSILNLQEFTNNNDNPNNPWFLKFSTYFGQLVHSQEYRSILKNLASSLLLFQYQSVTLENGRAARNISSILKTLVILFFNLGVVDYGDR